MRRILLNVRTSDLPQAIGLCQSDRPSIAAAINDATERLIYAGGDTGFWGGWDKVAFSVTKANPYLTLPAQYARAISLAVCKVPIRIQNEFYELMEAGIGLQPPSGCSDWCGALEGFERGVHSTLVDLPVTGNPQTLRVYPTSSFDVNLRILVQGAKDANGNGIYTQDETGQVNGFYITLALPFANAVDINGNVIEVSSWEGIVKDITSGDVVLKSVDTVTGDEVSLSRYLPWEVNPAYRRYYFNSLPDSCCRTTGSQSLPVTAMCKLDFVPVSNDTDRLIIGNLPALKEECMAIRASRMEDGDAAGREARHHLKAIRLLNQEMTHHMGKKQPAINFAPFGTAKLENRMIGQLR